MLIKPIQHCLLGFTSRRHILIVGTMGLLSVFPQAYASKVISTPVKPAVVVSAKSHLQRVCYYQGEEYSFGAVIEVSGILLKCDVLNDFEANGALQWVELTKKASQ